MRPILLSLALMVIVIKSAIAAEQGGGDCQTLLKQANSSLASDYLAFDQNLNKLEGWRLLADKQCYNEAATLIHLYMKKHKHFSEWQKANLSFHAGQMYAFAADYAHALKDFKKAIYKTPSGSAVRWNDYVKATIAFIQKDKPELLKCREQVAKDDNLANLRNLEIIDDMLTNFDDKYSKVYIFPYIEKK